MYLQSQLFKVISILSLALFLVFVSSDFRTVSANENKSSQVVTEANKLIGTKYVYGGTTPNGFDCSGFIGYVYKKVGVSLPRTSSSMYGVGTAVSKANLMPGDLVFFNTSGKGVSHAGIYVGNGKFINSSSSKGVSLASINDPYYWGSRYIGAKRVLSTSTATSSGITLASASTGTTLSKKPGQIGEIAITKNINLWQRDANNKIHYVRVLKAGEKYRVYYKSSLYHGQFGVGANMYITNMPAHIKYTSFR